MNKKQTISLIVAILGVVLIFFALHAKGRIGSASSTVNSVTAPFSSTPEGGMVRRSADEKLAGYSSQVQMVMIAGVILLIAGGAGYFYFGRKKR